MPCRTNPAGRWQKLSACLGNFKADVYVSRLVVLAPVKIQIWLEPALELHAADGVLLALRQRGGRPPLPKGIRMLGEEIGCI